MSKKNEPQSDHGQAMVRMLSKRPGDVVLRSGIRLACDKCILVTEQEALELEALMGPSVQRVD